MKILETERTNLREMTIDEAEFVLDLLNQSSFIRYIGDRKVRTIEQAREYIENRFRASYKNYGYGLWLVELKNGGVPIGINGFVKRDTLPAPDIGFAFLPQFEKQGLAFETADAVLNYGKNNLNFERVLAITSQDNENSGRLLGKLGFSFEKLLKLSNEAEEIKLFGLDLKQRGKSLNS